MDEKEDKQERQKLIDEIEQLESKTVDEKELNDLRNKKNDLKTKISAFRTGGLSETQSNPVTMMEIVLLIILVLLSGTLVAEHNRLAFIPLFAVVVLILRVLVKRRQI